MFMAQGAAAIAPDLSDPRKRWIPIGENEEVGALARGTYGRVYRATGALTSELVAVKRSRVDVSSVRELTVMKSLRSVPHPNVFAPRWLLLQVGRGARSPLLIYSRRLVCF